jgi:hypothetical protein
LTEKKEYSRTDVLSTIDYIISKIQDLRKIMLGVSISALVLAPFAIGLSIYLLTHPRFFNVLELENEFGLFLGILLGVVIIISTIWLYTGTRQYFSLSSWSQRYSGYLHKKKELDNSLSTQYNLDKD